MNKNLEHERGISPEKAIRLLEKEGIKLDPENAAYVVNYLYILAEIFYNQHKEL